MNAPYSDSPAFLPPDRFALPRYRVCLHSAGSDQTRRVAFTISPTEAVREFLRHGPLLRPVYLGPREEGSRRSNRVDRRADYIRLVDSSPHESLLRRSLADIARHLCERAEIRHAIVNSVAM